MRAYVRVRAVRAIVYSNWWEMSECLYLGSRNTDLLTARVYMWGPLETEGCFLVAPLRYLAAWRLALVLSERLSHLLWHYSTGLAQFVRTVCRTSPKQSGQYADLARAPSTNVTLVMHYADAADWGPLQCITEGRIRCDIFIHAAGAPRE